MSMKVDWRDKVLNSLSKITVIFSFAILVLTLFYFFYYTR